MPNISLIIINSLAYKIEDILNDRENVDYDYTNISKEGNSVSIGYRHAKFHGSKYIMENSEIHLVHGSKSVLLIISPGRPWRIDQEKIGDDILMSHHHIGDPSFPNSIYRRIDEVISIQDLS